MAIPTDILSDAPPVLDPPRPCTGCRNYHLTDADRIKAHPDENRLAGPLPRAEGES